ncbi:MAG TPA: hypothetical protein DEO85_00175 [Maritimibacter sp.]|nr:hypothetical protein [Maritimibacter sp.]
MTDTIPRSIVADALGVGTDALPEGDLPTERFGQRFMMFLRDTFDDDLRAHPEDWTAAVASHLAEHNPALSLATLRATLAAAETPEDIAAVAGGPLSELIALHGADLLPDLETLSRTAPRFALALSAVAPDGGSPLLWARVQAMTGSVLIEDDQIPGPGGL